MAGSADYRLGSLRPKRLEGERIALALAISLLIHTMIWAGYELNRYHHWMPSLPFLAAKVPVPKVQHYEEPVEFVMVDTPSTEAPKTPKYISNKNSVAADDTQKKVSDNPKLNGRQTDVPKTQDELRAQIEKALAAAAQRESSDSKGNGESKPAKSEGDLTLGKPDNATQPQEQPRPRTLKEAYQQMAARFPGMTMKEDGGAEQKARVPSLSVKVTGFGDYDARFIETVSHNWWNLLDSRQFAMDRTGKVVLLFRLNYDGSISQMQVAENTVGELLGYVCEKAVLDGAPYERWTEDMRLKLGDYTDVQFTFDYY
ncbi:MAG TPA: hypothetical protein VGY56_19075 [Verrucomicrobiae bacterium]|nr:hypothetical protein [Verrucomicrobiae bacterium]